eukprot:scaffold31797_cov63-Phaeocystis_antarctica.AAC.2
MASRLSGREPSGFPMGSGPSTPHRKATVIALPLHTPCPVESPRFFAATKLSDEAPTKRKPPMAPSYTKHSSPCPDSTQGIARHDEAATPHVT